MIQCLTCGGTYSPTSADGATYAHACPPVWDPPSKTYVERANKRDENPPAPRVLEPLLAATAPPHTGAGDDPKNALRQAAIVSAGAGVKVVNG